MTDTLFKRTAQQKFVLTSLGALFQLNLFLINTHFRMTKHTGHHTSRKLIIDHACTRMKNSINRSPAINEFWVN